MNFCITLGGNLIKILTMEMSGLKINLQETYFTATIISF